MEINNVQIDLSAYKIEGNVAPNFQPKRNLQHVPYSDVEGKQDGFPDELLFYKHNSSWHGAILNFKISQVAGKGFTVEDQDEDTIKFLQNINEDEDANEVLQKVSYDLEIFGGFALLITWTRDWSSIASIEHVSFDKIRSGKVNSLGKVSEYYYSYDWSKQRNDKQVYPAFNYGEVRTNAKEYITAIENADNDTIVRLKTYQNSQILYYKPYNTSNFYYPLPAYVACISSIRADINSDVYGERILKNGFSSPMHLNLVGNYTDEQKFKEVSNVIHNHTGSINAGTPFITFSKDKDSAPIVNSVADNSTEDRYKAVNEAVEQKILSGHRVTSPLLMGIALPGTLGNRDEIDTAYELFYSTVIKPEQYQITKVFNKLMAINNLAPLSIDKLELFENDNNNEVQTNNKE